VAYSLAGLGLIGFWALPPSFFDRHGQRLLIGGMETFALAGIMMVLGAVWFVSNNLAGPLQLLMLGPGRRSSLAPAIKMAIAFPLQHRFRTGMAVAMFALVIFTMIVAAVLLQSAQLAYTARQQLPTGYDIRATAPVTAALTDIQDSLSKATATKPENFAGVGSQASFTAEAIEPAAGSAAWRGLTVHLADPGLIQGTRLRLSGRARGYTSDQSVWDALSTRPDMAVVARGSLPLDPGTTTNWISRPLISDSTFNPETLWVRDTAGAAPVKLTVIGVVDDSSALPSGLLTLNNNMTTPTARTAVPVNFLFKVPNGADPAQAALGLALSFGTLGLETHVVGEGTRTVQNIGGLLNYVLEGFVGLGLVAGMAALGVISTRAVIERRQQIGMLRAIGVQRRTVQLSFLLETSFTAWLGIAVGIVLGFLLANNVVAFLSINVPELQFVVPWGEIAAIAGLAYGASLFATLVAAWQAGRITPAEALRYE
ncbi:MAG: ABC transporter permease, partial [Dehalococcoidia bacterium]